MANDLAAHARRTARKLRHETDYANYYRQPPEDATDIVAMAAHRLQLKKDAAQQARAATGRRRDNRTVGEVLSSERSALGLPDPDAISTRSAHFFRSADLARHGEPLESPTDMARKMLEQRMSQNAEMDAWKDILKDRRR
jgi:hypothetical protein